MKVFVVLACIAGALAFSAENFNRDDLVPVFETEEWQALHPEQAKAINDMKLAEPSRSGRVWGGTEVGVGVLPYQVGIIILLSRQAFCGGSIVSANFVLTAANCFPGDPNSVVELGHVDRNMITEFINAAQKILHPLYDPASEDNDIALVRLVRPVVFNNNIRAVRLPNRRQATQTFENQQARISGWGAAGLGAPINRFLTVGFAPVISQAACRIRYPTSHTERQLCIDGTTTNFCSSDLGGPVTIQDADAVTTQIGVKAFFSTLGCGAGWPGVFTRTAAFLDFIGQNSDVIIRDDF